jgi:hypothetical protein
MNLYDEIVSLLSRKKQTPNGWVSFNAVCCHHNGESKDTKRRGGIKKTEDGGTTYHCFNCGFIASWRPGRTLGKRMRSLLYWLGATDDQINRIAFECMKTEGATKEKSIIAPDYTPRKMPDQTVKITEELILNEPKVIPVVEYLYSRNLTLDDYNFHWCKDDKFVDRLIVPITHEKQIVGYIARKISDGKPRYLTEHPAHVVFNLDNQPWDRKFLFVFEGSIDAMLLGGVAVLTNEISDQQAMQINATGKQVVVVPDYDGPGQSMAKRALDLGWALSFPNWDSDVKDAADAVKRYGRLATMLSITRNIETNPVKSKIKLQLSSAK